MKQQTLRITKRRAVYLLPNLFTTLALLAGFWSIIRGINGDYELAAWGIILAALLDMLDGRIARLTGTESEFGRDYDSLSDVISFGIAPAILAFYWGLNTFGRISFTICFLYVAATAIRLARFSTSINLDRRFFSGLPCPIAGVTLASAIISMNGLSTFKALLIVLLMFVLAVTMVSTIKYYAFKHINLHVTLTTPKLVLSLLIFAFLVLILFELRAQAILWFVLLYVASGYYFFSRNLWRQVKRIRKHGASPLASIIRKLFR